MPAPRYPKPLTRVPPPLHARLDLVLGHLRAEGYVVEEGRCLRDQQRGASASAADRGGELLQTFA